MSAPAKVSHNRDGRVLYEPHPDCMACEQERINAERRAIVAGALRLEIMDLKDLVKRLGGQRELDLYYRGRRDAGDHYNEPCCTHGRALSAFCRRCGPQEGTEDEV